MVASSRKKCWSTGGIGSQLIRISVATFLASLLLPGGILACQRVYFGPAELNNIACQCNSTHCDSLQFNWPTDDHTYLRVVSNWAGKRFAQDQLSSASELPGEPRVHHEIHVDVSRRKQQVSGYGGAFTDSASQLITLLPEEVRKRALDDYFGPEGLDYNMGRVPISGTDMSSRAYSYDDLEPIKSSLKRSRQGQDSEQDDQDDADENDPQELNGEPVQEDLQLEHFKLQPEDLLFKIPLIERVNRMRERRHLEPLKLIAASWSAPAWMKTNHDLVQGKLKGNSSGEYYKAYARYILRFLDEYQQRNISIWALSPQNEPCSPKRVGPKVINFNSVNFEPAEMADFMENNMVPELVRSGRTPDSLQLFLWDDTMDELARYQKALLATPRVNSFARGLALHWYSQGLREVPYRHLYEVRKQLPPQYSLISTEASFIGRPRPGEWARGQRYARDLIENLRAGSVGWIDWNLALDMSGGPTWSRNYLDASMLVDLDKKVYYKNAMFYSLGHLSRFIRTNSRIVESQVGSSLTGHDDADLAVVAAELEQPFEIHSSAGAKEKEEEEAAASKQTTSIEFIKRRVALVVLNRTAKPKSVRLHLNGCQAKLGHPKLIVDLSPSSVTSLAFLC